ncbi:MAG TPA: discoidin domain-containing protein [Polyangiaceae bacterium]
MGVSLALACGAGNDGDAGSAGSVAQAGADGLGGALSGGDGGRAASSGEAGAAAGSADVGESGEAGASGGVGAQGEAGAPSNAGAASGAAGGLANAGAGTAGASAGPGGGSGAGAAGAPSTALRSVLTRSYDNQRSNSNLLETTLNVSNVNPTQFGKLFDLPVDDEVYAQILYVPSLTIGGATHNVIYVATVNNTLYAFDADAPGTPLWQRNFNGAGQPTRNTDVGQACGGYSDYSGNIGIVGTPVIDAIAHTMYVVTRTVEGGTTLPRLNAVDIATGADRAGSPALLQGSVLNQGQTAVAFDAGIQNQRMSLSLSEGVLYLGFSAFCDTGDYHGWLLAYDAATLMPLGVFNDTPDGTQAGIWQGGAAAAFDPAGNLYAMTGNGSFDGITNFGNSVLKLKSKTLTLLDYFTPSNYSALNAYDLDLGSAGPTWLTGSSLLVGGGKEGKLFLLDPSNLGHAVPGDTQILQSFQAVDPTARPTATHHIHNGLSVWTGPAGLNLYLSGENDYLRAFRFDPQARKFDLPSVVASTVLPPVGMPGGMLTTSADGARAGSGIVWVTTPRVGDANQAVVPGVLRAYNAETLELLWESTQPADQLLDFAKFNNPTVVNGKVYVASFSRLVSVYGLRSALPTNLAFSKVATGSASCSPTEGPTNAVNGSVIIGNGDKWCSVEADKFLQVDLGTVLTVGRVVLRHANAGGEQVLKNTRNFKVQVSSDGLAFDTVADVTGNQASITSHGFAPRGARYVRLVVTVPTQTDDPAARIYELEVYAR